MLTTLLIPACLASPRYGERRGKFWLDAAVTRAEVVRDLTA
jgi:hypothetical protein